MAPKLYKLDISPPARAAMMACDLFNVPAEMVDVDLLAQDHLQSEYLKKNPLHTVPVLEDGDIVLHDSHTIIMYLADTYGKSDSFYPKDVKQRALVNQKLFFDTGILFPRLRSVSYAAIVEGVTTVAQKQYDDIEEAYRFLEEFLTRTKYIAGDYISIADISAISNVTSLVYILPLNSKKYPKTQAWIKNMEKQYFVKKQNTPGASNFGTLITKILK